MIYPRHFCRGYMTHLSDYQSIPFYASASVPHGIASQRLLHRPVAPADPPLGQVGGRERWKGAERATERKPERRGTGVGKGHGEGTGNGGEPGSERGMEREPERRGTGGGKGRGEETGNGGEPGSERAAERKPETEMAAERRPERKPGRATESGYGSRSGVKV